MNPSATNGSALHQRIDALDTVNLCSIAAPGIDMSNDLDTVFAIGIQIGIKYTGFASKLQLTSIDLNHIKPGLAEHPGQCRHILADHCFEALR